MLGSSSSAKIHCPRSKPPEQAVCAQKPRDTSPSKQSLQNTKKNPKFPITPGNKSIHNNFTSQWHALIIWEQVPATTEHPDSLKNIIAQQLMQ